MDEDDAHDVADCDDPYCDEHWSTFHVEVERHVKFDLRVRSDEDADLEAGEASADIFTVNDPTGASIEGFSDDGDEVLVESETERREREIRLAEARREIEAEIEAELASS